MMRFITTKIWVEILSLRGAVFRSRTDTEVLVEAYRFGGEDMLHKLRRMFAFGIYDRESGNLFGTRDRVGKKPFVYAQTASAFIFASEIPAVKQVKRVNKDYDHAAIAAMLSRNLRHIPDPHTACRGIKKLRPGHAMVGGMVKFNACGVTAHQHDQQTVSCPITFERLLRSR